MKAEFKVSLPSIASVKEFVGYSVEFDGSIDLYSGRYIVDGKSIMGIFSLDLTKDLEVVAEGSEESLNKFMDNIRQLVVE